MPIIAGAPLLGRTGAWQIGALSMQTDDVPAFGVPIDQLLGAARQPRRAEPQPHRPHRHQPRPPNGSTQPATTSPAASTRSSTCQRRHLHQHLLGRAPSTRRTPTATSRATAAASTGTPIATASTSSTCSSARTSTPKWASCAATAFRRSYGQARFSPRPRALLERPQALLPGQRRLHHRRRRRAVETRGVPGPVQRRVQQRRLPQRRGDAAPSRRIVEPVRRRPWRPRCRSASTASRRARSATTMGLQRRISGGITLGRGSFYDGTLSEVTWRGRVEFTPQFYAEPTLSWNRVEGPVRQRQRQPREHAAHLHRDAADVRRRAGAVPVAQRGRSRPTCASAGNTSRAASSSSSTATAAPPPARVSRSCRTARWW